MKVQLQEDSGDRIVVEWRAVKDELCPTPIEVVIAGNGAEAWAEDSFSVLWRNPVDDQEFWEMYWRGNWNSCIKQFGDLIGNMDAEQTHDRHQTERTKGVKING
jgi:hypothetical protein